MPIYAGSQKIGSIYNGSQAISKAYAGNQICFQKAQYWAMRPESPNNRYEASFSGSGGDYQAMFDGNSRSWWLYGTNAGTKSFTMTFNYDVELTQIQFQQNVAGSHDDSRYMTVTVQVVNTNGQTVNLGSFSMGWNQLQYYTFNISNKVRTRKIITTINGQAYFGVPEARFFGVCYK